MVAGIRASVNEIDSIIRTGTFTEEKRDSIAFLLSGLLKVRQYTVYVDIV